MIRGTLDRCARCIRPTAYYRLRDRTAEGEYLCGYHFRELVL